MRFGMVLALACLSIMAGAQQVNQQVQNVNAGDRPSESEKEQGKELTSAERKGAASLLKATEAEGAGASR